MQIGTAITEYHTFAIISKTKNDTTMTSVSIHMFSWARNTINIKWMEKVSIYIGKCMRLKPGVWYVFCSAH